MFSIPWNDFWISFFSFPQTPLFLDFLACQARCIAGNAELPKVLWIRVDLKGAAKRTNMPKPAGVCSLVSFAVSHPIGS